MDNNELNPENASIENEDPSNESSLVENVYHANETNFTSKEKLYYKMIDKFFKELPKASINEMLDIIDGRSKISLRLLDWFVTRYANKFKVTYNLENKERFNVHISYKAQLKSYKKRYFDPFRRRKKFLYTYDKENQKNFCTTIGQLNFFRWAFSNKVVKYVDNNYEQILKSMINSNKEDKDKKEDKNKHDDKHSEENLKVIKNGVTVSAKQKITNDVIKIILSFD